MIRTPRAAAYVVVYAIFRTTTTTLITSTRKQQAKRSIERTNNAFDLLEAKRANNVWSACGRYICHLEINMECNVRCETSTNVCCLASLTAPNLVLPMKCRAQKKQMTRRLIYNLFARD